MGGVGGRRGREGGGREVREGEGEAGGGKEGVIRWNYKGQR